MNRDGSAISLNANNLSDDMQDSTNAMNDGRNAGSTSQGDDSIKAAIVNMSGALDAG